MHIKPTIYFQGACLDAIAFYQHALQAEVLFVQRIGGNVDPAFIKPGTEEKVLRAGLRIADSVVYLSDGHCAGQPAFQGFSLSIGVDSRARAEQIIEALAQGGKVQIPLRTTTWTDLFGTV